MPGRVGDQCVPWPECRRPSLAGTRVERRRQPKEDLVLRPKLDWRAAVSGGALCLAYACAAAVPASAQPTETQGTPTATAARVAVSDRRMNVRTGRRAVVRGRIQPAGSTVALQIRRHGRWRTLDRDRADARGAYVLHDRLRRAAGSAA